MGSRHDEASFRCQPPEPAGTHSPALAVIPPPTIYHACLVRIHHVGSQPDGAWTSAAATPSQQRGCRAFRQVWFSQPRGCVGRDSVVCSGTG